MIIIKLTMVFLVIGGYTAVKIFEQCVRSGKIKWKKILKIFLCKLTEIIVVAVSCGIECGMKYLCEATSSTFAIFNTLSWLIFLGIIAGDVVSTIKMTVNLNPELKEHIDIKKIEKLFHSVDDKNNENEK